MPLADLRGAKHVFYQRSDTFDMDQGNHHQYGTVHLAIGNTIRYLPLGTDAYDPDRMIYFEFGGRVRSAADRTQRVVGRTPAAPLIASSWTELPAIHSHSWTIEDSYPKEFRLRWCDGGLGNADPAHDDVALHVILDKKEPYEMWLGDKRIWHQQFVYLDQDNEASPVIRWFRDGDVIKYHGDAARGPTSRKVYLEGWGGQQYAAKSSNGTNEINFAGQASWTISRASGWNSADGFHVRVTIDARNNFVDSISDPIICTIHYNP